MQVLQGWVSDPILQLTNRASMMAKLLVGAELLKFLPELLAAGISDNYQSRPVIWGVHCQGSSENHLFKYNSDLMLAEKGILNNYKN